MSQGNDQVSAAGTPAQPILPLAGSRQQAATTGAESPKPPKLWYVIHTQTGQEIKVKSSLETKIHQGLGTEWISQILVPTERVAEIRGGKKRISERKFFPGYLLIQMEMTDESWHLVRTTPGVTGFIGAGRRPVALSDDEVNEILRQTEERKEKPTPRVMFSKGEGVRVIEGPFTNFSGVIEEVNAQRGKLKVMVSIFGRQTPVELEFWQVERL
jgi:transcriptional antiterminator NusG